MGFAAENLKKIECHMWAEHNIVRPQCKICGVKLKDKITMAHHVRIYHAQGGLERIKCEICGTDVIKNRYKDHVDLHNATEKLFQCSQCPKTFYTEGQLKGHARVHSKRTFMCELCDYNNPMMYNLKRHMQTNHSSLRPYKCDQCDLSFKLKANLTKHMFTHTGERNFPCSECGKAFRSSGNLQRHKAIHEGKFSEYCKICDKKFIQSCNYKLHMSKHHPELQINKRIPKKKKKKKKKK